MFLSPFPLLRCVFYVFFMQVTTSVAPLSLNAQQREVTISGTVRDATTGEPIVGATVVHDSMVVAMTNETGKYETPQLSVSSATIALLFRRIGYAPTIQGLELSDTESAVQVDVTLLPSATEIEGIVVRGERVAIANPGLIGFYQRRENGFGRYMTEEEIGRMGGKDLTNHLRRLTVWARPLNPRDPFSRPSFDPCVVAFIDGIRLIDLTTINEWLPKSLLAGIEVHRPNEYSHLPGGFLPPGYTCKVVMFWTKEPR